MSVSEKSMHMGRKGMREDTWDKRKAHERLGVGENELTRHMCEI